MEWFLKAFGISFGIGLGWVLAPVVILLTIFLTVLAFLLLASFIEWVDDMWSDFRYRFFPTPAQKLKKERLSRLR